MKISISGVRGVFAEDLNLKDIIWFCRNFSGLIKTRKCVLARDTRPSSEIISQVAAASLMERGIAVYNLGISPTPVAFRESRKYGGGLIVTSSHNPLEWNGLKFIVGGRGINESELKNLLAEKKCPKGKIGTEMEIAENYTNDAIKFIGKIKGRPKIAIDIGGGAAYSVAPHLLEKLGCRIRKINNVPAKSTRGPDPTAEKLTGLARISKDADIGFAFDLDGDRLVVVSKGRKQAPDVTLGLGIAKALDMGYRRFVLSIDTSIAVERFIRQEGGQVRRSKVGEANVVDLMLRTNSQAGGEGSSAGFILPEFNMCRDGLLTSGLIASMIGSANFSDVTKFMESYIQRRIKAGADSRFHKRIMVLLARDAKKRFSEVTTIDGIKGIIDEDSWVLVRPSNTEHSIRISSESKDLKTIKRMEKEMVELVGKCYEEARRDRDH
ncbi:MAG: phosphomannomutase [Thaumarchaeota archaeon]|nr:phosphomannomutase [Nitrososphaerota archaeon]